MAKYANGAEPAPALRYIMKNGVRLSNSQVEEFESLVESNGGWPQGVPEARRIFQEGHEVRGRAWAKRESKG